MNLEEAQKKYLNNRVSIKNNKGEEFVGNLFFLGYNQIFPSWKLCATINRLPIQDIDLNSIKIM